MFRKALVDTRGKCFILNCKAGKCVTFLDGRLSFVSKSEIPGRIRLYYNRQGFWQDKRLI